MFKAESKPRMGDVVSEELYTIGRMCEDYEVTPRTLRFYEAKELLAPIREGQE